MNIISTFELFFQRQVTFTTEKNKDKGKDLNRNIMRLGGTLKDKSLDKYMGCILHVRLSYRYAVDEGSILGWQCHP